MDEQLATFRAKVAYAVNHMPMADVTYNYFLTIIGELDEHHITYKQLLQKETPSQAKSRRKSSYWKKA